MPPGRVPPKKTPTFKDNRKPKAPLPSRPEAYARGGRIGMQMNKTAMTVKSDPNALVGSKKKDYVVGLNLVRPSMVYGDQNVRRIPGMVNKPSGRPKAGGSGVGGGDFLRKLNPGYSPHSKHPRPGPHKAPKSGQNTQPVEIVPGVIIMVPSPGTSQPTKSAPKTVPPTKKPTRANVRRK